MHFGVGLDYFVYTTNRMNTAPLFWTLTRGMTGLLVVTTPLLAQSATGPVQHTIEQDEQQITTKLNDTSQRGGPAAVAAYARRYGYEQGYHAARDPEQPSTYEGDGR